MRRAILIAFVARFAGPALAAEPAAAPAPAPATPSDGFAVLATIAPAYGYSRELALPAETVGFGVALLAELPPFELGLDGVIRGRTDAVIRSLGASAGARLRFERFARLSLAAEAGVAEYRIAGFDYFELFKDTSVVAGGGSATLPYVGARAAWWLTLGTGEAVVFGLRVSGRRTLGESERIDYTIATCGWIAHCREEARSTRLGGLSWDVGLMLGLRFDGKLPPPEPVPPPGGRTKEPWPADW